MNLSALRVTATNHLSTHTWPKVVEKSKCYILCGLMVVFQVDGQGRAVIDSSGALVVGNPHLTPSICQHWHLKEIPGAEYEARILGELLSCRPLIGLEATKGAVLHQIEQVHCCQLFIAPVFWQSK